MNTEIISKLLRLIVPIVSNLQPAFFKDWLYNIGYGRKSNIKAIYQ